MGRKYAKSLRNPENAVAYMRVSTEEQHLGPEAQRKQIEGWAQRQGVTVVAWHLDQGISGAAGIDQRPALARALNDLVTTGAGWLAVAKRDRLARDVYLAGAIEAIVQKGGARLASADGAPTGDSPAEVMQRQIGDVFAQYERAIIAARTKAALAVKKGRGERVGTLPYGFRTGVDGKTLEENPDEQKVIVAARALRARGITLRGIASMLDLDGFKTRAGTAFTHVQVNKMIGRMPRPKEAPPLPTKTATAEGFNAWRNGR